MGLPKTGYAEAKTGRSSEKLELNSDGMIAQDGEMVAGVANFSLTGLNASNSFQTNHNIIDFFVNLATGSTDSLSNKFSVSWEVE